MPGIEGLSTVPVGMPKALWVCIQSWALLKTFRAFLLAINASSVMGAVGRFGSFSVLKHGSRTSNHADLHFGNVLLSRGRIAMIDFDDCGFGFHAYDLVVPIRSAEFILRKKRKREIPGFRDALFTGYCRECDWDRSDEEIFSHMVSARALALLAWFNSRSDNPGLRKHFKRVAANVVKHFRSTHS
ncbi:MAG TPA: phosphotransferase [Terriglobia bacterium]|nr:phosphotransferase [Terriglobia bacterium]